MIQSRAQFGYRGVVVVLVGTLFTFIGFNVADSVLIANGLEKILGWNETLVTLIAACIATGIAVYGHDWLHRIFRWRQGTCPFREEVVEPHRQLGLCRE
jgi:NCS1 family nucleobase:cation symporter-1